MTDRTFKLVFWGIIGLGIGVIFTITYLLSAAREECLAKGGVVVQRHCIDRRVVIPWN